MADANRILPLNNANAEVSIPKAAIQSITMAIRVGPNKYAVGYVYEFGWDATRDVKALHQMEPYPDGTFDSGKTLGDTDFLTSSYWPGEPVEVVPGKIDVITLTLKRYALYTSNLLAALMRLNAAGTEDSSVLPTTNDVVNDTTIPNHYVTLIQQVRPVEIYQMYISPTDGKIVFGRKFEECWFTKIGETIPNADTNEAILEEGELKASRIRPYYITESDGEVDTGNP